MAFKRPLTHLPFIDSTCAEVGEWQCVCIKKKGLENCSENLREISFLICIYNLKKPYSLGSPPPKAFHILVGSL